MPPTEEVEQPQPAETTDQPTNFQWQASEFVAQDKGVSWYLALAAIAAVLAGLFGFLGQWISVAVVVSMALAIMVYAHRSPRVLMYGIGADGINVDGKLNAYNRFRSYSVHPDVAWQSIDLEPTKRFGQRLTILCSGDNIATIEAILAQHLPRADREIDTIERLSRYLRF